VKEYRKCFHKETTHCRFFDQDFMFDNNTPIGEKFRLMRFSVFCLWVICLSFVQSQNKNCYLVADNYIEWSNTTNSIVFKTKIQHCFKGWCSFAFSKNSSIDGAKSIFIMFQIDNKLHNVKLQSHNGNTGNMEDVPVNYNFRYTDLFDLIELTSNVTVEFIGNDLNFVLFASNGKQKPSRDPFGKWTFPKHEKVDSRSLQSNPIFNSTLGEQNCYTELIFPPTLENLNPIPFFIGSSKIHIFLIFLCLILKNDQPMKSRGIFNVYGVVWSIMMNFTFFVNSFEWRTKYDCYFTLVGFNPTTSALITLLVSYNLRIVLTLQVNNHKLYIRNQNGKKTFIIRVIIFLKFLTSDWIMIISSVFIFLLQLLTALFILFLNNWKCSGRSLNPLQITYLFVMAAIAVIINIFDLLLVSKSLFGCKCRKVFIDNDPFMFRIQQLIGITFVGTYVVILVSYAAVLIPLTSILGYSPQNASYPLNNIIQSQTSHDISSRINVYLCGNVNHLNETLYTEWCSPNSKIWKKLNENIIENKDDCVQEYVQTNLPFKNIQEWSKFKGRKIKGVGRKTKETLTPTWTSWSTWSIIWRTSRFTSLEAFGVWPKNRNPFNFKRYSTNFTNQTFTKINICPENG
jgi:hypothetical protein